MTAVLPPHTPFAPLADLARDRAASLRPSEQRVVQHLLALDPLHAGATAEGIAGALGVSRATVVNTVQRLGYGGFAAFRRSLILERALTGQPAAQADALPKPDAARAAAEHPAIGIARRVLEQERAAIDGTEALLAETFPRAVQVLADAPSVLCIGAELSSAVLARLTAGMLTKFAVRAVAEEHASEQRALVEVADPGTALVVISYRGANEFLTDLAVFARSRGLTVITLTNNPGSPLARAADVSLLTGGAPLFDAPTARRIGARSAQFALARALAEAVGAQRTRSSAGAPRTAPAPGTPTTPGTPRTADRVGTKHP
jgi:DNA-binding MurR/RpiR family transcriptional regulator